MAKCLNNLAEYLWQFRPAMSKLKKAQACPTNNEMKFIVFVIFRFLQHENITHALEPFLAQSHLHLDG